MIRVSLLLVFLLIAIQQLLGQVTIYGNNLYYANQRVVRYFGDDQSGQLTAGDSGVNRTYNFSNWPLAGSQDTMIFVPKAARTWGSDLGGNVVAYRNVDKRSQTWYSTGVAGCTEVGANVINSSNVVSDVLHKPRSLVIPTTASYGTAYNQTYVAEVKFYVGISLPPLGVVDSVLRRTTYRTMVKFDGWGTLTLPNGQSMQVLRQRINERAEDTADGKERSTGRWRRAFETALKESTKFVFWSGVHGYEVAWVSDPTNSGFLEFFGYIDATTAQPTNVADNLKKLKLSLSPNPAKGQVAVLGLAKSENYRLRNSLGQVVQSGTVEPLHPIPLTNLSPGYYSMEVGQSQMRLLIE